MNSKNYKDLGIKLFKASKFDEAKSYFSLAYEDKSSEELLALIDLCEVAKSSDQEALSLFEIYINTAKDNQQDNINEIINILQSGNMQNLKELDYENAITYADFKNLLKGKDFKDIFQSVMFSTKIIIADKEDLLEFVTKLIDNGYDEMGLNYLESSAVMFAGDIRIEQMLNKLRNKNENLVK